MKNNLTDLYRQHAAAHELGHAMAFRDAGIAVKSIRVVGNGPDTYGFTDVDMDVPDTQKPGLLVAILAGEAAGVRWCERNDVDPSYGHGGCDSDRRALRRYHAHPAVRGIPVSELKADARQLVRVVWSRIERLTPRLAVRGTITL